MEQSLRCAELKYKGPHLSSNATTQLLNVGPCVLVKSRNSCCLTGDEGPKITAQVTSHFRHLHFCHGSSVTPFGRLPLKSTKCDGSSW